jgi:hypothetical protein
VDAQFAGAPSTAATTCAVSTSALPDGFQQATDASIGSVPTSGSTSGISSFSFSVMRPSPIFRLFHAEQMGGLSRASSFLPLMIGKLGAHFCYLLPLGFGDLTGEATNFWVAAIFQLDLGHSDRPFMVGDHGAHEVHIGVT